MRCVRFSTVAVYPVAALAIFAAGCTAQQQPPPPPEVSRQAAELLAATPRGMEREGMLVSAEYLTRANVLLQFRTTRVDDLSRAVLELEGLAAYLGPVTATVRSTPPGLQVTYRRIYDPEDGEYPVITTDGEEMLDVPTHYIFTAINPATGEIQTQRKNCLQGCTVIFVFEQDPGVEP